MRILKDAWQARTNGAAGCIKPNALDAPSLTPGLKMPRTAEERCMQWLDTSVQTWRMGFASL